MKITRGGHILNDTLSTILLLLVSLSLLIHLLDRIQRQVHDFRVDRREAPQPEDWTVEKQQQ